MAALVFILDLFLPRRLRVLIDCICIAALNGKRDTAFLDMMTGVCCQPGDLAVIPVDILLHIQAEMPLHISITPAVQGFCKRTGFAQEGSGVFQRNGVGKSSLPCPGAAVVRNTDIIDIAVYTFRFRIPQFDHPVLRHGAGYLKDGGKLAYGPEDILRGTATASHLQKPFDLLFRVGLLHQDIGREFLRL